MDLASFETHARTFGASLDRWPDALRTEARELLLNSERAQQVLEEAGALDRLLDEAALPFDAAAFADRAVRRVAKERQLDMAGFVVQRYKVVGMAAFFCMFMGAGLGAGHMVAEHNPMMLNVQLMLFGPDHFGEVPL